MLKVEDYERIRREHTRHHKSINSLSKEYHHSTRTIKKILTEMEPPGYRRTQPILHPKVDAYKEWIETILELDRKSPKKQRHTARRLYDRLRLEQGYDGCESTIRRYVRQWKQSNKQSEGFIRLCYEPGIDAQVDFGEALAIINNREETVHILSVRMCWSSRSFQVCFPCEKQESLFEGLRRAFEEFTGVPHKLRFDNMRTVVSKVLKGINRQETDNFIGFRSHYLFESEFCAPGKGNEKGHVETLVGYGRRNFMVPIPKVNSYEELNHHLVECCRSDENRMVHGKRVGDLFEEEKSKLLELPARAHSCRIHRKARVNKFQEVQHDHNVYSVPLEYVNREVWLHIGVFDIEIEADNTIISRKKRCWHGDASGIDPMDYMEMLERKSRSVDHAKVLKDWNLPEVFGILHQALKQRYPGAEGNREYVRILKLSSDFGLEVLEVAASLALDCRSVGSDSVKNICYQLVAEESRKLDIDLSRQSDVVQTARSWEPNLSLFDRLLEGPNS